MQLITLRAGGDAENAYAELIRLAQVIEEREPDVEEHCRRVAGYVTAFGLRLGLSDTELELLERAAVVHDVGMALVPERVFHAGHRLTPSERAAIRQHPAVASELCERIPELAAVAPILRAHHERYDGSGYPDRLRGEEIPLLSQVLGIIDAYDAMTAGHAGRRRRSASDACAELRADVRNGWRRSDLVESFIELVSAESKPVTHPPLYVAWVTEALTQG